MNNRLKNTFIYLGMAILVGCAQTVRQDELIIGIPGNATDKVITFDTGDGGSNASVTASDTDQTVLFSSPVTWDRPTGTSVGKGGVAISSSSGTPGSISSGTMVDVTNLSVTITTFGNPVKIFLMCSGDNQCEINARDFNASTGPTTSSVEWEWQFLRDSTVISRNRLDNIGATDPDTNDISYGYPPGGIQFIDDVAAGTYTYKIQVRILDDSSGLIMNHLQLVAYEL